MNLWAFDKLIVKMLRAAGYNERADAVARAASERGSESRPSRYELPDEECLATVPFQHHGASLDAEAAHGAHMASGPDAAEADRPSPTRPTALPGQQAASAAEVGHGDAGDRVESIGHASPAHDDAPAHAPDHASRHAHSHEAGNASAGAEPGAKHGTHPIDPADPLAGLHSSRLRDSLEREAFSSASGVAQDSAIVARADSFARRFNERAQSFGPDSVSIDISRPAQDARISALHGEIPPFARGDAELDPAIIRVLDRATSREPAPAPAQGRAQAPAMSLASTPVQPPTASARVRDGGMER
jgi:hypothetical protein